MSPLNPLNPEAGDVPVPDDPREIAAALRAGRISQRLFPYIRWRYTGRGDRFTSSDSAWLVWLTRYDQDRVFEQIRWLRSVLSNRGMPSWILQTHLGVLCRQLHSALPENQARYASLEASCQLLRQAREEAVTPQAARALCDEFAAALGQKPARLLNGSAQLVISAVADETLGIKRAVSSLLGWMLDLPRLKHGTGVRLELSAAKRRWLDSQRFAQQWPAAVEAVVEKARRITRVRAG